jgi:hypothetical protein
MLRLAYVMILLLVGACEPMGPVAGGSLSGEVSQATIDWEQVAGTSEFQLETRPDKPYSINIWGVGVDKCFYVAAGDMADARWVPFLDKDPNVRLRIGDTIHELQAIRIQDNFELRSVRQRYIDKYDLEDGNSYATVAWVYRLDSRPEEW